MQFNSFTLAAGLLLGLITHNANALTTAYVSDGQNLVYSSLSNITWIGDGNLLGTLEFSNPNLISTIISTIDSIADTPNANDTPSNSGNHTLSTADFGFNGLVSWFGAKAFVGYLNHINYAGSNQWALPSAGGNPHIGYNQTDSQFGQLFYNELGGTAGNSIPDTADFTNELVNAFYWFDTEYAPNASFAWHFSTLDGYQNPGSKNYPMHVWAVSPGQMAAVPLPGAVWLLGAGLLGLLGLNRRGHPG